MGVSSHLQYIDIRERTAFNVKRAHTISDEFRKYVDEKPEYLPVIKEHIKLINNELEDYVGLVCVAFFFYV